jgi:diguanylate cyclase (GGDEF)-like protein
VALTSSLICKRMKYAFAIFVFSVTALAFIAPAVAQNGGQPARVLVTEGVQDISGDLRRLQLDTESNGLRFWGVELDAGDADRTRVLVVSSSRTFGAGLLGFGQRLTYGPTVVLLTGTGADDELATEPLRVRRVPSGWAVDILIPEGETLRLAFGATAREGRLAVALATPEELAAHDAVEARLRGVLFGAALMLLAFLLAQGLLARRGLYFVGFLLTLSLLAMIITSAGWHDRWVNPDGELFDGVKGAALMLFLASGIDFARRAMQLRALSPVLNRIGLLLILIALGLAVGSIASPALIVVTAPIAIIVTLASGIVVIEGTRQDVDGPKLILGPWVLFAFACIATAGLALFAGPRFGAEGVLLVQGFLTAGTLATALSIGRLTTAPQAVRGISPTRETEPSRGPDLRLTQAVSGARKGVWDWKIYGDRLYLSRGAMALLGYDTQGGEGKEEAFHARVHDDDQAAYRDRLRREIDRGTGHFSHDMRVMDETGNYRWMRLEAEVTGGTTKTGARIVGLLSDISVERASTEQVGGDGLHDMLTGLASRALFMDRLLQAEARDGASSAAIVMDVDRFQAIIDGVGHGGGDTLLIVLARRLEGALPGGCFPARLGADEFGVLVEEKAQPGNVYDLCETIRDILTEPLEIEGEEIFPALSFGIAFAGSSDKGEPPFLRRAEIAMYHGKRSGGSRIETYRPEFAKKKGDLMSLEAGLNRALERREVELLFQPIMSVMDGRLAGFEALMRWNHPERGQMSPNEFLDLAEETGAIVPLGRYVVEAAAAQLVAWQTVYKRKTSLFVGVNLSARQILHHDLTHDVEEILKNTNPARRSLVVEVTEAVVMENPELAERRLSALAGEGLGLALDDFGTGYSSLSHLARFAFDKLKIDREFIEAMENDENTRTIVRAIIGLATDLGQGVVAEGVQSEEQLRILNEMGCGFAQGYFFGKPMTAAEAERMIINDQKVHKAIGEDIVEGGDEDQARPASPDS